MLKLERESSLKQKEMASGFLRIHLFRLGHGDENVRAGGEKRRKKEEEKRRKTQNVLAEVIKSSV